MICHFVSYAINEFSATSNQISLTIFQGIVAWGKINHYVSSLYSIPHVQEWHYGKWYSHTSEGPVINSKTGDAYLTNNHMALMMTINCGNLDSAGAQAINYCITWYLIGKEEAVCDEIFRLACLIDQALYHGRCAASWLFWVGRYSSRCRYTAF